MSADPRHPEPFPMVQPIRIGPRRIRISRRDDNFAHGGAILGMLVAWALLGTFPVRAQPSAQPSSQPSAQPTEPTEITLGVGEQRVISSDGVRSYSEGARGVVDVRLTKDVTQFVLVGLKPGTTTLLFILHDGNERHYRIEVRDESRAPTASAHNSVQARDNIRLDFYFVQLDKTYQHRIGVAWPGMVGGGHIHAQADLLTGMIDSATAVVADQALPRLDMAQTDGWAKLLRQAAIITANGSEATFSGGGEVNIPIQGSLAAEIRSINFGSEIQVLPRYDERTGRIELQLEAEVADLTDDGGSGAPGRTTSTLRTVVNIELGQSLVLGGLTTRSKTHTRDGLPVLSRIPIIGGLFGTSRTRELETENVVFIVPTVVDAISMEARERIREAIDSYDRYKGNLARESISPVHPPAAGASHDR